MQIPLQHILIWLGYKITLFINSAYANIIIGFELSANATSQLLLNLKIIFIFIFTKLRKSGRKKDLR